MPSRNPSPATLGWPLLAVPDELGELHWPSLETSVRQLIEVILRTRPGEQLMRPRFGAGVEEMLGEPSDLGTRRRLRDLVREALVRWEKRIQLDAVDVLEVPGEPGHLRVAIAYRLRRTGLAEHLAMTLELT